jgi:hypothetical protein
MGVSQEGNQRIYLQTYNVIFQHPVALYRSDLGVYPPSKCNVIHYSYIGNYMFRPNRPSSGVQVIVVKDSAAHWNATTSKPNKTKSNHVQPI